MIAHRCRRLLAQVGPEEAERFVSWNETEETWHLWFPGHSRPAYVVEFCPFCGATLQPGPEQAETDKLLTKERS